MHNHITLEISPNQIENMIESLPLAEKIRILHKLQRETWARRLDNVVQKIRSCVRKARVSVKDIDRICEEVKREYDEKLRRH